MKDYYIYIYLDPRKLGYYSYESFEFKFQPFYVGLGKNKRDISHIKESLDYFKYSEEKKKRLNKYKIAIIKSLIRQGLKPIIIRIKEQLTREEAIHEEIKLIKHWGRKSIGDGFLSNMTPGGEGPIVNHTKESMEKFTKWWKLTSPEGKEYIVHGLTDICKKYNLDPHKISSVAEGKRNNHKGWNCYKIIDGNVIIKDKKLLTKEEHYGEKFSKNVSNALKDKKFTKSHRKNISIGKKGKPLTKTISFMEGKKQGGLKLRNRKNLKITKNWQFISPDGKIYNVKGMKSICDKFKLIPSVISQIVKNKYKHKNWHVFKLPDNFFDFNEETII